MSDAQRPPVTDWTTDFDHTDPQYGPGAPEIWDMLREVCPVAHSDRFGGTWLPVRHEDVTEIAHDTDHFSSVGVIVSPQKPEEDPGLGDEPPITSDPPFHTFARRLLLPAFSPKAIDPWEETTREVCRELLDELLADDPTEVDAALGYTQHIPVRVIAKMLGVPAEDGDKFRGFIHRIIETPGAEYDLPEEESLEYYLDAVIEDHRQNPREDLTQFLMDIRVDDGPLSHEHVRGSMALLLIAGIDTTWSAIGSSLWHLAQNPDDRHRIINDPDVIPFAVEELLRFYAPVTMARIVAQDVELGGQQMKANDWVLLPFPAANRDPEAFDDADQFVVDRAKNRHSAFGLGIHRCIGSNLARMELRIAVEEWLARVPDFELNGDVRWSAGQIRGPRELPVKIG